MDADPSAPPRATVLFAVCCCSCCCYCFYRCCIAHTGKVLAVANNMNFVLIFLFRFFFVFCFACVLILPFFAACSKSSTLDVPCPMPFDGERGVKHQAYLWCGQLWRSVSLKIHASIPSLLYASSGINRALLYTVGRKIKYNKILVLIVPMGEGTTPVSKACPEDRRG